VNVSFYEILTSALDGDQPDASDSLPRYPLDIKLGGLQSRSAWATKSHICVLTNAGRTTRKLLTVLPELQ
jgi:hypothetical protein